MARDVQGKVVLVTGSANGLGLAIVDHFLANGAKLAIMLDMNDSVGLKALENIKAKHGNDRAVFFKCNVTTDLEKVYNQVIGITKNIDVVVNNAGVQDEKNLRKTIDVNITAVMEWTMKFFEHMRKDKGGSGGTIINVSSIYGFRVTAFIPYYHASKFAVLGFSKSLGHKFTFNLTGVRVVTLCPGLTKSNMTSHASIIDADLMNEFLKETEETDWQEVDDIGSGTVEIFQKADSGTAWLVEGARPAERISV